MKKIVVSAAFLLGVSSAAFADMNNKPSDYVVKSQAGATHALAIAATASKQRNCDEAAGSEGKLAACDSGRRTAPGGSNSGSN